MKKLLVFAVLLLFLPAIVVDASFPARPTTSGFVFDFENVIDDEVEQELNKIAFDLQQQGIMELFLVTVSSIGDADRAEYGLRFFREWGIGDKNKNNGIVIYATTDMGDGNNVIRFATGYGMEGDYPDGKTGEMLDTHMMPSLAEGNYTKAFASIVDAILVEEGIEHTWETVDMTPTEATEDVSTMEIIVGTVFIIGMLLFVIVALFRFFQRLFYGFVQLVFGKDIRSERYKRYLAKKQKRREQAAAAGYAYSDYDSGGSSDSYSGGGGDSGGGGSDRSF